MKLTICFEDADDYLLARVEGRWTPDSVSQGIQEMVKKARDGGHSRVLLDLRKLSAPPTDFARFRAGEQIAEMSRGILKIAAVYPEELINKFAEDTAVNRGAQFTVVADFDEAVQWLLSSPSTRATE